MVVATAAGESRREKEKKNPTNFSETCHIMADPTESIYMENICFLWTMSSVLSFSNTHTIEQSELK